MTARQGKDASPAIQLLPPSQSKYEGDPIKFTDAVGRKFTILFHVGRLWQAMEMLIKQIFHHLDELSERVNEGRYDLVGPNEEIILPSVWIELVVPGKFIRMAFVGPEPEPPARPPEPPPSSTTRKEDTRSSKNIEDQRHNPLLEAGLRENAKLVKLLLERGADPKVRGPMDSPLAKLLKR